MTDTNIFYETGDIQFSTCQTIVVPVNCEGTMDEGIASIFRRRYPYMFERYKWICEQGLLAPGKLWIYNSPSKRKILIFPVLQHGDALVILQAYVFSGELFLSLLHTQRLDKIGAPFPALEPKPFRTLARSPLLLLCKY